MWHGRRSSPAQKLRVIGDIGGIGDIGDIGDIGAIGT